MHSADSVLTESIERELYRQKVKLGKKIVIEAKDFSIGANAFIGDYCEIRAEQIAIGNGTRIENNVQFGMNRIYSSSKIQIGDEVVINQGVRASLPSISIGDYGVIHSQSTFYGNKKCRIGHNCWIGQGSVLNTKEELIIGNNFRLGVGSQVWTHVASGELIEGCEMYKVAPTIIEDDVWLVGHVIVSPGIRIGRRTIVLPGAVVSKDTLPGHCYAGIPAVDITDKYNPYREVTIDEKFNMLKLWVDEFLDREPNYKGNVFVIKKPEDKIDIPDNSVVFTAGCDFRNLDTRNITYFDVITKKYNKRRSTAEIALIKELIGHKARFIPMED